MKAVVMLKVTLVGRECVMCLHYKALAEVLTAASAVIAPAPEHKMLRARLPARR